MSEVSIVKLRKKHLKKMLPLYEATYRFHQDIHPRAFRDDIAPDVVLKNFKTHIEKFRLFTKQQNYGLVAESGDELCGYILYLYYLVPNPVTRISTKNCLICDVAASEKFKRKKIGTQLLQEVVSRAKGSDVTFVQANVWDGNSASDAFFKANGFQTGYAMLGLELERN